MFTIAIVITYNNSEIMLLSLITHGRLDNWMGSPAWRMTRCLNKWGDNFARLGENDVEIVLCDWGSPTPIVSSIPIEPHLARYLRHVTVPPSVADAAQRDSEYSSSHAVNVAARRSQGRFILNIDSDVYFGLETARALLAGIRAGQFADIPLATSFFWASRRHVPKSFNDGSPGQDEIDAFITANRDGFAHDKIDMHRPFCGATCALLTTKDMWWEIHGIDEKLIYWGFNDIDAHERLKMRYRFGGDLESHGMEFYHLEHYSTRNMSVENPRKTNPMVYPSRMQANDTSWGLANSGLTAEPLNPA